MAAPFVALADVAQRGQSDLRAQIAHALPFGLERFIASVVTALVVVVFYGVVRRDLDVPEAVVLALVLAFGSGAWSAASRGLWAHGPSMLMLMSAFAALRSDRPSVAGALLAFAYVVRPTNAIAACVLGGWMLRQRPRAVPAAQALGALVLVPWIALNWQTFGSTLPPYYDAARLGFHPALGEALAANLISPARGLLVYSPWVALCAYGAWLGYWKGQIGSLEVAAGLVVVLHWVAVSSYPHWWAGSSYGPRFMTDIVPYLLLFAVPVIQRIRSGARTLGAVAALLVAVSVVMHGRGACVRAAAEWNFGPPTIDQAPQRVWDWADPPYLRR